MSEDTKVAEIADDAVDFVAGKLERGGYCRFSHLEAVPAGTAIILPSDIQEMKLADVVALYSSICGVGPKKFKSREVAVKNLVYQITKLPIHEEPAEEEVKVEPLPTASKRPTVAGERKKYQRKAPNEYEVAIPTPAALAASLKEMPPQARDCVEILLDLVKATGKMIFPEAELRPHLEAPEQKAKLRTRQSGWRILQYYRSRLIGADVLRVR